MISYSKQNISWFDAFKVFRALKGAYLTQGPATLEFEKKICHYTGAKYAVVTSNATTALHLAMLAINLNEGDEVITSPITFVASSNSVLYTRASIKFADINTSNACINPDEIKKVITKKTKAIIPVHFAGQPCDMDKIFNIAQENKLYIVEDAAHALGSTYKGRKIGGCHNSDMAIFSFHAVKNITSGEGGAITTNNQEIYEKLILLRSHGITKDPQKMSKTEGPWYYEMQELGFNYRLTDIQATLGIAQLKKLDIFSRKKREILTKYKNDFQDFEEITFLKEEEYSSSSFHLCIIKINFKNLKINRKQLFEKLLEKNISLQIHYIPVHLQPYYQKLGFKKGDFPKAEEYYEQCLSIPLYPSLKENDRKYFVAALSQLIKENKI